jgi:hypothetical protein
MDKYVHTYHHPQPGANTHRDTHAHVLDMYNETSTVAGQTKRAYAPAIGVSSKKSAEGARAGTANRWALQQPPAPPPTEKATMHVSSGVTRYSSTWVAGCLATAVKTQLCLCTTPPRMPPPSLEEHKQALFPYCTLLVAPTHPGTRSMQPLQYQTVALCTRPACSHSGRLNRGLNSTPLARQLRTPSATPVHVSPLAAEHRMMQSGVQRPRKSSMRTAGHKSARNQPLPVTTHSNDVGQSARKHMVVHTIALRRCMPHSPNVDSLCHTQHTRATARYPQPRRALPFFGVFTLFSFFWARTPGCTCICAGAIQLRAARLDRYTRTTPSM